jgi:hypothetical protein
MGVIIGGHGNPPLRWLSRLGGPLKDMKYAPRAGNIALNDEVFVGPSFFQMTSNKYRYQTLLVFGCWAGLNDWVGLGAPQSPYVAVASGKPNFLIEFPFDKFMKPPSWEVK